MSNPLVIKPYDISQKFTHRQLYEDSPSSRDGMSLDQQHYCRRMYVGLIQDAGMQLRLPQGTISTAIMFCHRYYAVKSMVKNDRFIMATASLFLAGKADETPKALRDVMKACFEVRYSRRPKELEKLADAGVMDLLRERIVVGERALVYAINFDFNVRHPYKVAMQVIDHFKLHILPDLPPDVKLQQVVWNMINDSYRSLLALEYTAEDLGVALTFFALQLLRVRPPLIGNMQWWDTLGVSANTIGEIGDAMVDLYQNSQKLMEQVAAGRQPGPVSSPAPHSNDALPASSARQLSDSRPSEVLPIKLFVQSELATI
eukprot:jgi/Botrbrau1/5976/Bobra.104_1s0007.2